MSGAELKQARAELGLTQAQLAARLDVTANTIAGWERDEIEPASPEMLRLALRGLQLELCDDGEINRLRASVNDNLKRAREALSS